jgi:hypothetical protein
MSLLNNKQLRYPLSGSFTGSFSGSLFGTASYAVTASHVTNTSSFFLVGGNSNSSNVSLGTLDNYSLFLIVSGSTRVQISNTGSVVTFTNQAQQKLMTIKDTGVINILTQSAEPIGTPNLGDIYITTGSLYIGLE